MSVDAILLNKEYNQDYPCIGNILVLLEVNLNYLSYHLYINILVFFFYLFIFKLSHFYIVLYCSWQQIKKWFASVNFLYHFFKNLCLKGSGLEAIEKKKTYWTFLWQKNLATSQSWTYRSFFKFVQTLQKISLSSEYK